MVSLYAQKYLIKGCASMQGVSLFLKAWFDGVIMDN